MNGYRLYWLCMGKLYVLKTVLKIPSSIDSVWSFFSDPENLKNLTPPSLNLVVQGKALGKNIYPGQLISYKVRPVFNIPVKWITEITQVENQVMFIDEQRKGPYRLWHHEHHFKEIDGGTEMTDLVHYMLPFGFLGNIAHPLLVKNKLQEIFTFRFQKIQEIFGVWSQQQEMQINIECI